MSFAPILRDAIALLLQMRAQIVAAVVTIAHEVINPITIMGTSTGKRSPDRFCSAIGHSLDTVFGLDARKIAPDFHPSALAEPPSILRVCNAWISPAITS